MPQLRKRSIIAAKEETTDGTLAAPAAGDYKFLVYDVAFRPEFTILERNPIGPSFARKLSKSTLRLGRVTFSTEVVGAGDGTPALGTEPAWAILLRACGFKPTASVGVNVIYDPTTNATYGASNGNSSLTMYVDEDGIVRKLRGCRGTFRLMGDSGGIARFEWDFLGIFDSSADQAYSALAADYDSQLPPLVESATFALQGTSLIISNFSIDIGNAVAARLDANSPGGFKTTFINDRKVTATVDPEQELTTVFDAIGKMVTDAVGAFTITIGTASKNRLKVTAPAARVQVTAVDEGERDNILTNNLTLDFNVPDIESATNKEIRFTLD